jgi:biopolymer transport protein ExbB
MFTDKFFAIAEFGHEITLWVLVALSIFSLAFILERFISLRKVKSNSFKIQSQIKDILQSHRLSEVEELSRDKDTLEGRALAYGLRHAKENGEAGLSEIFSSYASVERPALERYLNFLATVGSNAPFIGLLGTVFGIMDAFRGLAQSQGDASAVMIGISKALVATAIGLMVAIPAIIAYNHFQKQVKSSLQSLESVRDLCIAFAKTSKGKS